MELAPAYSTLWTLTLKSVYHNRLEKTVRHCYFTLVGNNPIPTLASTPGILAPWPPLSASSPPIAGFSVS